MFCQSCGSNVADGVAFCPKCGRPIAGYAVGQASAAGGFGGPAPAGVASANYAGFWLRLVAAFIDRLILLIPTGFLGFFAFASMIPGLIRNQGNPRLALTTILPHAFVFLLLLVIGSWLYWALLESSSWQATVGKKAMGLYVTDSSGAGVTFAQASGRFFAGRGLGAIPYVGGLYYLVDCICAGLTERKQAVHDMIAGCLVLKRP
jgi:uncharacterized RDD family membrane protein YckC